MGNTESMQWNRPELVRVTQVKNNTAKETRFACSGKGAFVRRKNPNEIS